MPITISSEHPTWALKPKIQEVCQPFMDTFGFNYFQYLRCYRDGSIGLLTNHTGLTEEFKHVDNEPVVFSHYDETTAQNHAYWFLWDETLPEYPVQLAREKFNLRNGMTYLRRQRDYYDMIAVAVGHELDNPGTFYLNKMRAIEQYVAEFDRDNRDLIQLMDNNPIALPQAYRDTNYAQLCLTKSKIIVAGRHGRTHITAQELACLRLFILGATHKEIAKALNLSPRTVETYMQRVKQRTALSSRYDFEQLLCTACP